MRPILSRAPKDFFNETVADYIATARIKYRIMIDISSDSLSVASGLFREGVR